VTLRREVCTAAAGARTEQEFFTRLAEAGVSTRKRYSTTTTGEVTGYAVGLPRHTAKDGGIVWYGGGKLAADLTLPKLRHRWTAPETEHGAVPDADCLRRRPAPCSGTWSPGRRSRHAMRPGSSPACVKRACWCGCGSARSTPARSPGTPSPCPAMTSATGPLWYGGGRLSADLTLPRLRQRWNLVRSTTADHSGAFRFTAPERGAIYTHTARRAAAAAEHIRRCAQGDTGQAADAAWAAADTFHVAARALRNPELRRAADSYDRAARSRYGRTPRATREGNQLRTAARLMALTGTSAGETTLVAATLIANLVALAVAVAELREAQRYAAQATPARAAAAHLHAASIQARSAMPHPGYAQARWRGWSANAAALASADFPMPPQPGRVPSPGSGVSRPSPRAGPLPPRCAGPGR
jgi:hypothetical protein